VYSFGLACPGVIPFLASRARVSDVQEIKAVVGMTPLEALTISLKGSAITWTGYLDGVPCCLFGVGPAEGDPSVGVCWMIGTDDVERYPLAFLKASRRAFAMMLSRFPVLVNCVDARHEKAIRWLRWLGAEIHPAEPYGVAGLPFHFFRVRRG